MASGGVRDLCAWQPEVQSKVDDWTYWAVCQRQRPCAGGTSVKSHETDRQNGYENRSPVFSYKRSPNYHYNPGALLSTGYWILAGQAVTHLH